MPKSSFYPGTDFDPLDPPPSFPAPDGSGNDSAPSSFFKGSEAFDAISDVDENAAAAIAAAAAAAASAAAAAASLDNFDDRYLGAKAANPTLDNDGNTLLVGALYFNTSANNMRVWDGASWLIVGSGVASFNSRTGAVVPVAGDYTATQITNTPAGTIASTTVQAALNELDSEKAPLASPALTGTPTAPTAAQATQTTQIATTQFVEQARSGHHTGVGANTTLVTAHNGYFFQADATGGSFTLTLDATANLAADWNVRIYRSDATANTITINTTGGQTIDGRTSARLISAGDTVTIRKLGSTFVTENARWKRREVLFTASGTFTILNEVPIGCLDYKVEGWGAGGSGGGSNSTTNQRFGGGAGGAKGIKRVLTNFDTSLTITIGTGGASVNSVAGGVAGNAGGNTTIVGSNLGTLTAGGGSGGTASNGGGTAGTATGFDENLDGQDGLPSLGGAPTSFPGLGGDAAGDGGQGGKTNVNSPGKAPGGGGACANDIPAGSPSGAGANGRVRITI